MKQRDLINHLKTAAATAGLSWHFARRGGKHDVYILDGQRVPIPRHREINEMTAAGIMKDLEDKLGKEWWR